MKTKLLLAALCGCTFMSCQKLDFEKEEQETNSNKRNVQFIMKGIDVDYTTRATLASENITDLWVWEGSTLLKHQTSSDTDFGTPTISLTVGAHDLTFVASKSDGQAWTSGKWTCTKVKDTYGTVMSYTVSGSSSSKQVQLSRLNGKIMWTIEDALPTNINTININVNKQCYGLDSELSGTDQNTLSASFNLASYAGVTGITISAMILTPTSSGEEITGVITASSKSSQIFQYTNTVSIKPNQIANIHGSFFSGSGAHELSLSTAWGTQTDYNIN